MNRPGIVGDSIARENGVMNRSKSYSPEIWGRAVPMVFEHQREYESEWAAMCSILNKIGCTAETLRKWVRRSKIDRGETIRNDEFRS